MSVGSGVAVVIHDCEVPVIAVFTKYEPIQWTIEMDLEDGDLDGRNHTEERFKENYLCHLGAGVVCAIRE